MGQTQSASPFMYIETLPSPFFFENKHTRNEFVVLVNIVVNGDPQQTIIHPMIVIMV